MSNLVYINVLVDSLQRKSSALQSILEITKEQEQLLRDKDFDESEFIRTIGDKQKFIDRIQELDNGFESIFARVKAELRADRGQYSNEIEKLKSLITQVTGLGIDIEALEQRNKVQMEKVLTTQKEKIKDMRVNNSAANNYYRNMASQQYNQSYFLDKKK